MKLILCIDSKGGLAFHGRRQSQDRALREQIFQTVGGGKLWMDSYSRKQFPNPVPANLCVDEDFLQKAGPGDYCFAETRDPAAFQDQIQELTLFCWNRDYPADLFLTLDLSGWILEETQEFPGFSHEKITKERYVR